MKKIGSVTSDTCKLEYIENFSSLVMCKMWHPSKWCVNFKEVLIQYYWQCFGKDLKNELLILYKINNLKSIN